MYLTLNMKTIITIILIFLFANISFGQNRSIEKDTCNTFAYFLKSKEELLKYVDNPCPNDSNCLTEISKAKSEIATGKITFCMPQGLMIFELRQEQQLRKLCKTKGLNFQYQLFDCFVNSGQTDGCYGLYMDKVIANRFGGDFKMKLLKEADSLYVATNPMAYYTNCDTLPRLYNKDIDESTEMDVPIMSELFNKLKISMYGYYPQVDIGFYIDTAGIPSKYFLSQFFIYDDIEENIKFKSELTKIAFEHIKQFKIWKPGIILNQKVKTEYNVRISFVNETKK